jgi:ATP-binding protein involved in chromosome partitioning
VVENMSGFTDPATGRRIDFFSTGGGERLAAELGVPLLGQVPLQPGLAEAADRGRPIVAAEPTSPAAVALGSVAGEVARLVDSRQFRLPILNQ